MAVQTGLCLGWSETPEDTFCHVMAQFCFSVYIKEKDTSDSYSQAEFHMNPLRPKIKLFV